jgi:cytochrome c biogenesis protein CcmG/thiol:disulfide interchange protein DsbE
MHRFLKYSLSLLIVLVIATACGSSDDEAGTIQLNEGALTPGSVEVPETDLADLAPALRLSMESAAGDETTLASYVGSPLVVNLWASWCAFCIAEMPDFESVFQDVKADVSFVGINIDSERDRAAADQLAIDTGVTYDITFDTSEEIGRRLGSIAMPATAFISAEGEILKVHNGQLTAGALRDKIDEFLLS